MIDECTAFLPGYPWHEVGSKARLFGFHRERFGPACLVVRQGCDKVEDRP